MICSVPLSHPPPLLYLFVQTLRELDLSFNKLRELPHAIGGLLQLQTLNAAYNQLQKLCPAVGVGDVKEWLRVVESLCGCRRTGVGVQVRVQVQAWAPSSSSGEY